MAIAKMAKYGVEPYDKEWGVGISGMEENPSPYPRINRIKKRFFSTPDTVDHERACLVTEIYEKYPSEPQILKCAKAMDNVLRNVSIKIYPDELIVGEMGAPARSSPIFPEFSYNWIIDEMQNYPFEERSNDVTTMSEETKKKLFELEEFWKGNTVEEQVMDMLSEDDKKGSNVGRSIYWLNLYLYAGVGHVGARYERIFSEGFGGIKKRIEEKLAGFNPQTPDEIRQWEFWQAELIVINGAIEFVKRYARLAQEMAEKETDSVRKKELQQIASVCGWVSENPARTFWDALQLWHIATNLILVESNGHSVSYGRFDQILYPYYQQSIKDGVSKEFMTELTECAFYKIFELNKLRDRFTILINANAFMGGPCITIGGVDMEGHDATNELSYMFLDAHAHTRTPVPWMAVRLHQNTPWEFKVKVANTIKIGTGQPKVYNDEGAIPAALNAGRTLQDARDYQVCGCVEIDATGREYGWHDASYFSCAQVFELAINNGRCFGCGSRCPRWSVCGSLGKRVGIETGSLSTFKSFDEVLDAYDKQMKYWVERMIAGVNAMDISHQRLKPLPILSLFVDDCINRGIDVTAGGAIYNFSGPQGCGLGTVADGMAVIKQLVFDEKKVAGDELRKAVEANWEGYEPLYALVNSNKVHHYGNDDDYADELAIFAAETYCKYVEKGVNARGGKFIPGVYSVSANVGFGLNQWASPDGRKAFEPISDCIGAVHNAAGSHDVTGPTAMAKSAGKIDHVRCGNGTLLNWKFTPTALAGEAGRDNLINLIDTYFSYKGLHSQFAVVSKETLLAAQANPEQYKGLLVRVAGYSAYFVELSKELQGDIIGRTEYSFD